MPFDDEDDSKKLPSQGKGLKFNNNKSSVVSKKKTDPEFNEKANAAYSKYEEYKKRTWELSTLFKSFIEDRTILENKGPLAQDLEKETIDKLVLLASEMNADENQPEGIGSIALSVLLVKCLLIQRNSINELSYKISKLEKS